MSFKLKLIKKEEICRDTYGLYFDITGSGLTYIAGQFVTVTIPDLKTNDGKGNKRHYSIANAPDKNNFIEIIIRNSGSDFSNYILNLQNENELLFSEAQGSIRSDKVKDNSVFIAGGTGITPVRSILQDLENRNIDKKISLFYANRSIEYAAFFEEFTKLKKSRKDFLFVPIFEETDKIDFEKGFFTGEILKKHIKNNIEHVYYVTGPPLMLSEAIKVLVSAGVTEEKIIIESA
jgi:NAD(P)H-flavin reductase